MGLSPGTSGGFLFFWFLAELYPALFCLGSLQDRPLVALFESSQALRPFG